MLRLVSRYFIHKDERGSIQGLINWGSWEELNLITSESGVVRGNHYHKLTEELFIILEGDIEIQVQKVSDGHLIGTKSVHHVKTGDVFWIEPMTNHIFIPKKFSKWINALSKPVNTKEPDFFRINSYHA